MAEKGKISGYFKSRTSVVLHQCQNKVSFLRKGSYVALTFLLSRLNRLQCCLFIRKHFLTFKRCSENFDTMPEPLSLKANFILTLPENNRNAVFFVATTDFAFSSP